MAAVLVGLAVGSYNGVSNEVGVLTNLSTSTSAAVTIARGTAVTYGTCKELDIVNDGGNSVYISADSGMTSSTGIRLNANGGSKHWGGADEDYCGPVYAATAAGTSSLTIHRLK